MKPAAFFYLTTLLFSGKHLIKTAVRSYIGDKIRIRINRTDRQVKGGFRGKLSFFQLVINQTPYNAVNNRKDGHSYNHAEYAE